MKEEIKTHFEHTLRFLGTNRAAEPHLTTTDRGVYAVSPQPSPSPMGGFFFSSVTGVADDPKIAEYSTK